MLSALTAEGIEIRFCGTLLTLSPHLCLSRVCLVSSLLVPVHLRQVQAGQVPLRCSKIAPAGAAGAGTAYCIQLGSGAVQAASCLPVQAEHQEGNKPWSPFLHVIFFLTWNLPGGLLISTYVSTEVKSGLGLLTHSWTEDR